MQIGIYSKLTVHISFSRLLFPGLFVFPTSAPFAQLCQVYPLFLVELRLSQCHLHSHDVIAAVATGATARFFRVYNVTTRGVPEVPLTFQTRMCESKERLFVSTTLRA